MKKRSFETLSHRKTCETLNNNISSTQFVMEPKIWCLIIRFFKRNHKNDHFRAFVSNNKPFKTLSHRKTCETLNNNILSTQFVMEPRVWCLTIRHFKRNHKESSFTCLCQATINLLKKDHFKLYLMEKHVKPRTTTFLQPNSWWNQY